MGYPCMLSLLHSHPFLESFSGRDAPVLWEGALMGREEMVRKEAGEGSAYGGKGGAGEGNSDMQVWLGSKWHKV